MADEQISLLELQYFRRNTLNKLFHLYQLTASSKRQYYTASSKRQYYTASLKICNQFHHSWLNTQIKARLWK